MEDGVLTSVLGGGFFVVSLALLGFLLRGLARLRADEGAPDGVAQALGPPRTRKGLARHWGLGLLLVIVVAGTVSFVLPQLTPPVTPLVVKVTAYQFGWKFDYYQVVERGTPGTETVRDSRRLQAPDLTIQNLGVKTSNRLTLPQDVPVLFLATSLDVIHRFSAPEFLVRRDVVPGQVTPIWVEARTTGRFALQSDEMCGADGDLMLASIDVVEENVFETWLSQARPTGVSAPPEGDH